MEARQALIDELLGLGRPPAVLLQALAAHPVSPEPLAVLTRQHLSAVLQGFLDGEVDAASVSVWAVAVTVQLDIGREPQDADSLNMVLGELSVPRQYGPITRWRAMALRHRFR